MLAGEGVYWVVPEELEVKAESSVGQVGAVAEATLHCMVGSMQANWQPLRPRRCRPEVRQVRRTSRRSSNLRHCKSSPGKAAGD